MGSILCNTNCYTWQLATGPLLVSSNHRKHNHKKEKNIEIGLGGSPRIWKAMASAQSSGGGDFDRRQTEAQGGFEGESHCWTDPIRLKQDKQLGVDVLCPRLL